VRSELGDIDPGPGGGAVNTHENPRSQLTDRTTRREVDFIAAITAARHTFGNCS
jgi:hypothetical protein